MTYSLACKAHFFTGIQIFNTTTNTYTAGRLLAGLPSNNNSFLTVTETNNLGQISSEMVYVATNNGVARWNATEDKWKPWTPNGLPISFVEILSSLML